jgi:hypothetical protein
MRLATALLVVAVSSVLVFGAVGGDSLSIDAFGAQAGNSSHKAAVANGIALRLAMLAANEGFNNSLDNNDPSSSHSVCLLD